MTKKNRRRFDDEEDYKPKLSKLKEEKKRKKERNLGNALRSRNIDKLLDYDDE